MHASSMGYSLAETDFQENPEFAIFVAIETRPNPLEFGGGGGLLYSMLLFSKLSPRDFSMLCMHLASSMGYSLAETDFQEKP